MNIAIVGATGNVIMACVNLNQEVLIENAAMEPEIVDLCNFLSKIGVKFEGIGTTTLKITGVDSQKEIYIEYTIIPDRIEAGTFMIAALISKGNIIIENIVPQHLTVPIKVLKKMWGTIFGKTLGRVAKTLGGIIFGDKKRKNT